MPAGGHNKKDIQGQKFGKLTAINAVGTDKHRKVLWRCVCECGNESVVTGKRLRTGHTSSCGCIQRQPIHGMSHSRIYSVWRDMVTRCNNPSNSRWKDYGGRGITVCSRWLNFSLFLEDMGEAPEGMSLERIDNNQGYALQNCKWATSIEQASNRRTNKFLEFQGQIKTVSQWARDLNISISALNNRLRLGWDISRALTEPINEKFRRKNESR